MIRKNTLYPCIVIIFLLLNSAVHAINEIGSPFIKNYYAKEYKGHAQNWCVTQDDRNVIFIGNGDGVLMFDGKTWELLPLPNNITARTLKKSPSGIIYVGSINELGFLRPNNIGKVEYISLYDSLGIEDIGTVWDIHFLKDDIYFRTEKYIIRLNKTGFKYWKSISYTDASFIYNNKLFFHQRGQGLFVLDNNIVNLAPLGEKLKDINFDFGFENNNVVYLASSEKGLFTYTLQEFKYLDGDASKYCVDKSVYRGTSYNGNLFIATNNGGCIIVDKNGKILQEITTPKGLQSNNIHHAFIDNQNNLWLPLNKGIAKCEISVPITFWDQSSGLDGIVLNTIRFNETLYIASHQGLYYLENNDIKKLPYNLSQTWFFLKYKVPGTNNELLMVSTNEGIFIINGKKLKQISPLGPSFYMHQSRSNPNLIYVGFSNDIGVIEYKNGSFNFIGKIPDTGISIRSIQEDQNGNIWGSTFRHGVFRIKPSESNILVPDEIKRFTSGDDFTSLKNILIHQYNNKLIFSTESGMYEFNEETEKFIPINDFNSVFDGKHKDVFLFHEDKDDNIWLSQLNKRNGSLGFISKDLEGNSIWNSTIFNRIPEMMVLSLYIEDDGTAWIGGSEGLFKYNPEIKIETTKPNYSLIRKVYLNNDSVIFYGNFYHEENNFRYFSTIQNNHLKYELDFKNNSISFNYATSDFYNEDEILYQYILEGFNKEWSDWSTNYKKEYTNLPEGNYSFKVRSINTYNKISETGTFEFIILPPWYRSIAAYIAYLLIGVFIILVIVKISIRRLKLVNTELERLVQKRTSEINQQKEEILAQAEELERQNKELEKLSIVASKTDNAIAIADATGKLEWVNEAFTRLYGYTFDDLQELNYKTLQDFSISENINETINYCLTVKKSKIYESLNHAKSGNNIWAQTTITPIVDENDNVTKLIVIDSDISKLKLTEMEVMQQKDEIQAQRDFARQQKQFIEQQNKELEKHRNRLEQLVKERTIDLEIAKEKAEQSDKLKSAFLANMSHEIRTPMNAIIGFSNLLTDNEIGEENRDELVSHIVHNSNTLLHLIDDIIDIAKIEAGQLEVNKKNFKINEILHELIETFVEKKKTMQKEEVNLIFKPEIENASFTIFSDPLRVQQIFTNLIDNALKFTEKGFIEVGYNIEDKQNNSHIVFYVRDTGIGLNSEQQLQIFSRFTKFENDKKKLYRGAGLGLAICKNISNLLGGDIWVESELSKGSVFYFTIPFLEVAEKEKTVQITEPEDYRWAEKTVLIAEDEESNYRFLEMTLAKTKLKLIWAKNGKEAVELFKKNDIDIILMDIKMPEMDGLEATKIIKQIDEEIPIIAQTAFAMENDEKIAIQAGCNDYISKPIRKVKLLKLINKYLSKIEN